MAGCAEKAEARAEPAGEPGGAEQSERVPDPNAKGISDGAGLDAIDVTAVLKRLTDRGREPMARLSTGDGRRPCR